MTIIEPKNDWTFSWQWLVDFLKRVLADVFGFIGEEEGWTTDASVEG